MTKIQHVIIFAVVVLALQSYGVFFRNNIFPLEDYRLLCDYRNINDGFVVYRLATTNASGQLEFIKEDYNFMIHYSIKRYVDIGNVRYAESFLRQRMHERGFLNQTIGVYQSVIQNKERGWFGLKHIKLFDFKV